MFFSSSVSIFTSSLLNVIGNSSFRYCSSFLAEAPVCLHSFTFVWKSFQNETRLHSQYCAFVRGELSHLLSHNLRVQSFQCHLWYLFTIFFLAGFLSVPRLFLPSFTCFRCSETLSLARIPLEDFASLNKNQRVIQKIISCTTQKRFYFLISLNITV